MKVMLVTFMLMTSGTQGFSGLTTETFDSMEDCNIAKEVVISTVEKSKHFQRLSPTGSVFWNGTELFVECKEVVK